MNAKRRYIEAVERELLREIKNLAGQTFVYEDCWGGMAPFEGELSDMQTGPPRPFAELTWREQADVLRSFIRWDNYPARDWDDEYVIKDNIVAGKPIEQWLEGTSLHESFRLLAEGKTPPPAKEFPEITVQDLRAVLAAARPNSSAPQERASAEAKAFQDIFRNDAPREAETKTQEWSGWEV
jgi:hypothetical protein